MKLFVRAGVLLTLILVLSDCSDKCTVTNSYVYYQPVYSTPAEIRAAVDLKDPQPLVQPGKIYFKDQTLFINEI
jgi:hypothetical protein